MWTTANSQRCVTNLDAHWTATSTEPTEFGALGTLPPAAVLEALRSRRDLRERDRIARVLVSLAQEGHTAADQLLLVAMLPRVVHLTRSCRGLRDLPMRDAQAIALGAMWEAIRTLPAHATTAILHRLSMDALNVVTRTHHGRRHDAEYATDPHDLTSIGGVAADATGPSAAEELAEVLRFGVESGVLTSTDVRILAAVDLGAPGDREALAAELGIAPSSLTRRAHRLRTRLRDAVRDEIAQSGRW